MFRTLKGRAALGAAVLIALGVALVTTLQSHLSEKAVLASIMAQHENYTARVAADVGEKLQIAGASLVELAGKLPIDLLHDTAGMQSYLSTRAGLRPLYQSINVFSLDGNFVASAPPLPTPVSSVADREWFRQSIAGSGVPIISQPIVSRLSGNRIVVMTAPVHDESGVLRALMVGTLRLDKDHVLHTLSKARIGHSGYFVLVARDGTIVVHPDLNLVAQPLDVLGATGDVIREALARSSGTTLVGLDRAGKRSIFSFQTVALPDWVLVGIQPNEEALAALSGLLCALLGGPLYEQMWVR